MADLFDRRRILIGACFALGAVRVPLAAAPTRLEDLRLWASPDGTRVVVDLSAATSHQLSTLDNPPRVVVDLDDANVDAASLKLPAASGIVSALRVAPRDGGKVRVVMELTRKVDPKAFLTPPNEVYGHRLVIDLPTPEAPQPVKAAHAPNGRRDLVIAIDAGHGGEDPGAIGKYGTREKDVVLAISRKLAAKIEAEPGLRAVLTRTGDYFVRHRERMNRARRQQADLFVSIHADAFPKRTVRGSSVYVLSPRGASDEAARWLAAKENAADLVGGVSLDDKDNVLASVLLDLSQNASLSASLTAADHVLRQLDRVGELKRSTVQQAGFIVLKSPDFPSMLIETAFISNPDEEKRLRDPAHQDRLATAILAGIRGYFYAQPPQGTLVAELARNPGSRPPAG